MFRVSYFPRCADLLISLATAAAPVIRYTLLLDAREPGKTACGTRPFFDAGCKEILGFQIDANVVDLSSRFRGRDGMSTAEAKMVSRASKGRRYRCWSPKLVR